MASLPESARVYILSSIDKLFETLRQRAGGPYYRPSSGANLHSQDKVLSVPGMYSAAFTAGPLKNQQPSFDAIKSLTSTTDAFLVAAREKLKSKTLAELEAQLKDARSE